MSASLVATGRSTLKLRFLPGLPGKPGPANVLTIGTVTTGTAGSAAAATISGTSPAQVLSLTIPKGDQGVAGPVSPLAVGTVTTGAPGSSASATITGSAPNQALNLTIPRGDAGSAGTGSGNVNPTGGSYANGKVALFADATGNLIKAGPTLGDAAAKNTGTASGTLAAGDDGRITGAAQKAQNLADLASLSAARANLGLGSAGSLAFRNRLLNGTLAINTRGAAAGSTAYGAGSYVMDRFKAGPSGCTLSWAAATNGDVTATITAGTLVQVVEGGLYLPEGGAYVLSWAGSAQARIYQGAASGSYAASPLATAGLTAGTNATVEWGTGTLTLPQLEPGTAPTAFERRPLPIEQALCRRYARRVGQGMKAFGVSTTAIEFSYEWPDPMRATPVVSLLISAVTCTRANIGNSFIALGSAIDSATGPNGGRWYGNLAGGSIGAGEFMTVLTADVFLFTAEI